MLLGERKSNPIELKNPALINVGQNKIKYTCRDKIQKGSPTDFDPPSK